jgi:hypothetical protein
MKRLIILLFSIVLAACSSAPPPGQAPPAAATSLHGLQPAHFSALYDPAVGRLTFTRLDVLSGAVQPESTDPVTDCANCTPGSLEVSLSTPVGGCGSNPAADPLFCEVDMTWGGTSRTLINPVVQIDKAGIGSVDAAQTSAYNAVNSDGSNPLGLDTDHGLWVYTNEAVDPTGSGLGPWYLSPSGSGYNTGKRTWELLNPGGTVQYDILVWASFSFSNETPGTNCVSYVDVCGTPGASSATTGQTSLSIPFDFLFLDNLYAGSTQQVGFSLNGEVVLGGSETFSSIVPPQSAGRPTCGTGSYAACPPSASYASPVIWPFFDGLQIGSNHDTHAAGQVCWAVLGRAPTRQFAIEWRDMDFSSPPDQGSDMDFEVFLDEGSSQIDCFANYMIDGNRSYSRAEGATAFIGTQDVALSNFADVLPQSPIVSSGFGYSFYPTP